MTKHPKLLAIALAAASLLSNVAQAQPTAKEQYDADAKRIAARYADDKKICASEGDSATRMQCNRDAKTEYDKAMANAKTSLHASSGKAGGYCADCAKVLAVNVGEKEGEGSALGVIAGGVAGALLGIQVGSGHGRQLATVAGAAGGAYAGNQIEKKAKSSKVWTVQVQYEDGHQASYHFDHDPGMIAGDHVKNANGSIVRN